MSSPLIDYRELFPVIRHWIYFNHAATSPYSVLTARAVEGYVRDMKENGGMNHRRWNVVREEARVLAGCLLNCPPESVALVSNTSEGANIVAQGLDFKSGDNVVIPDMEFPANVYPWLNLGQKGIETRRVDLKKGRVLIEDICARIDGRTKLVAASSVAYHNGYRLDLESLGRRLHEAGIPLYVDAIQSLGVIPMDVRRYRIAFLCADGHKWLLAPEGAALFYCAEEWLPALKQAYLSWLSVCNPFDFDDFAQEVAPGARRFECGAPHFAGIVGLHQSMKTLLEVGIDRIMTRVLELTDQAEEGLRSKGYEILSPREKDERSGILTFSHPKRSAEELTDLLNDSKVVTTLRGGGVRISPHFYNSEEEIERFLDILP